MASLRDFEGKLKNHGNIAKIGLFLSYHGFSSECIDELKRMGRGTQMIILVDRINVLEYVQGAETFLEWLEKLIVTFK